MKFSDFGGLGAISKQFKEIVMSIISIIVDRKTRIINRDKQVEEIRKIKIENINRIYEIGRQNQLDKEEIAAFIQIIFPELGSKKEVKENTFQSKNHINESFIFKDAAI